MKKQQSIYDHLRRQKCYVGIYAGNPQQMTAVACYFPREKEILVRILITDEEYSRRIEVEPVFLDHYKSGDVIVIDGNYIGVDEHEVEFDELIKGNEFKVIDVGYRSGDEGVAVRYCEKRKHKQRRVSMRGGVDVVNATKHFENLVSTGELKHEHNKLLEYQLECTEIITVDDNSRPSVRHSSDNICGVLACLLAVHGEYNVSERVGDTRSSGILGIISSPFN